MDLSPTLIPLTGFGVIQASGPDTQTYLQGQLTCDLVKLPNQQWTWGGHCDPKGKLIAAFRLTRYLDAVLMVMPQPQLEADLAALNKYAVFNKIEIQQADYQLFGLMGTDALALLPGEGLVRELTQGQALIDGERALIILEKGANLPDFLAQLPVAGSALWQAGEILTGRPYFEAEQVLEFIPQMLNLDAIGGIQYDKGCYIGQETVARMHFRGGNKRALYALQGPATEGELELQLGENWRSAGSIVSSIEWQGQQYVAAVMSKELEPDSVLRIGKHTMTLQTLPYKLYQR